MLDKDPRLLRVPWTRRVHLTHGHFAGRSIFYEIDKKSIRLYIKTSGRLFFNWSARFLGRAPLWLLSNHRRKGSAHCWERCRTFVNFQRRRRAT